MRAKLAASPPATGYCLVRLKTETDLFFGEEPDLALQQYWVPACQKSLAAKNMAAALDDLHEGIENSDRAKKWPGCTSSVTQAVSDILGRVATKEDLKPWRGPCAAGQTTAEMRTALAATSEAKGYCTAQVRTEYKAAWGKEADQASLDKWAPPCQKTMASQSKAEAFAQMHAGIAATALPKLIAPAQLSYTLDPGPDENGNYERTELAVSVRKVTDGSLVNAFPVTIGGDMVTCGGQQDTVSGYVKCLAVARVPGTYKVTFDCRPGTCQEGFSTVTLTVKTVRYRTYMSMYSADYTKTFAVGYNRSVAPLRAFVADRSQSSPIKDVAIPIKVDTNIPGCGASRTTNDWGDGFLSCSPSFFPSEGDYHLTYTCDSCVSWKKSVTFSVKAVKSHGLSAESSQVSVRPDFENATPAKGTHSPVIPGR